MFDLLRELAELPGVSGYEGPVRKYIAERLNVSKLARTDNIGNLIIDVGEGKPHIALVAHMDEVGLVVTKIEEDGSLRFRKVGGVDEAGAHMYNLAAGLFARGCTEMARILEIMHATTAFAYGLPGAGDLYVTSVGGRTVRLGKLLGQGYRFSEARQIMAGETLEAAEILRTMGKALPKLTARGVIAPDELPLLRCLVDIVVHDKPVDLPLDSFFPGLEHLT